MILPTFNQPLHHSRIQGGLTTGLGSLLASLLMGSLLATSASAQVSAPTREQPPTTLRELLETRKDRPAAPVTEPSVTDPDMPQPEVLAPTEAVEQTVRLRLDLSDREVYVYRGETLEASYPVAIGRPGWETPTGEYEVYSQIVNPGWTSPLDDTVMAPGPDNPLGDRWIAFWTDGVNEIGFHGTPNRDSVGQAASHGCVRMYNEDVRELYEVVALGTPVVVEP